MRLLACVLLVVATSHAVSAASIANEDRCVPGESFPFYCNTCSCGDDGLVDNAVCTWMRCYDDEWNRDGTRKPSEEVKVETTVDPEDRCVPGESFQYYCNTCSCGDDGLVENALCPFMRCDPDEWNRDGTRKPLEAAIGERNGLETCKPGTVFKYYCNDCYCREDGLVNSAECTRMSCDDDEWNRDGTRKPSEEVKVETTVDPEDRCVPGESFQYYCNTCSCGDDGLVENALCPFMRCDPDEWNRDGTRKPLEAAIGERNGLETCKPGTVFKYYCNDCYCREDGLVNSAECTRMSCDDGEWNADGTRKYPEPEAWSSEEERKKSDESCAPGESFNYYCNSCTCGAEGKVAKAQCTNMECDRLEWNKDGSEKPFSLDPVMFVDY